MFTGSMVALVTPFSNGRVDYKKLRELVNFQIQGGTEVIVPMGTTGESPTVSNEEHREIIKAVVEEVAGRIPVIAGSGSNCTEEAIKMTQYAKEVGANGSLQVNPYYNRPTQEGLYAHFSAIAKAVDLPIVLYNIPGRSGVNMEPKTVAKLAQIANIVAIKEASGLLDQVSEIAINTNLTILSGDDSLTLPICSVGGKGVISVISNIVPKDVRVLTDAIQKGDYVTALKQHKKLFALSKSMLSLATNPIPIKAAMAMMGMITEEIRLPLVPLAEDKKPLLAKALKDYGLLK